MHTPVPRTFFCDLQFFRYLRLVVTRWTYWLHVCGTFSTCTFCTTLVQPAGTYIVRIYLVLLSTSWTHLIKEKGEWEWRLLLLTMVWNPFWKKIFRFFLFSIPRWRKSKHKKQHLRELRSGFLDFQLRNCKLWISD